MMERSSRRSGLVEINEQVNSSTRFLFPLAIFISSGNVIASIKRSIFTLRFGDIGAALRAAASGDNGQRRDIFLEGSRKCT